MNPSAAPSNDPRDEELRRRESPLLARLGLPSAPESDEGPGAAFHGHLMERARALAVEHCLKALDAALRDQSLSRQTLPAPVAVGSFGTLTWATKGGELDGELCLRLALRPGGMVGRGALLAHEQRLVAAYTHPTSLAVLLQPDDGGPPLKIPGPRLEGDAGSGPEGAVEALSWETAAAGLGGYWRRYRPCLDCFVPAAERGTWGYEVGQAASAADRPAPRDPVSGGRAAVFSVETEGNELVFGVEWQPQGDGTGFEAFKEGLGSALGEMRIPFTCVSEFPSSGRLYLSVAAGDRPRLEACIDHFNRAS